jgi:superfamily I DNA and/or RNA helicase
MRTCCLQSTLEGQAFDVLLLDESSQMTEPTSLVPLLRAKPRCAQVLFYKYH